MRETCCVYLRVVGKLGQLVLDSEKISRLVRNEFIQIDQAVEKDSNLCYVLS